ncbi:nuclear pore complex protein Nup214 isoform 3-T3 [Leptodactylus fuscus]|uniref:nuclear pore complex protein Nup214 isoform X3 n=1 Tax=Leptodactylus fuscus TaxID=238119 RepID=UPI003F4F1744
MEDDTDVPQERETKDFQFRQLKKTRIFPSPPDLPKERSNLLAVSNKFGFVFAGGSTGINIYRTDDVLIPIKPGEDPNDIVAAPPGIVVPTMHPVHHVALSSDDLTLSVCTSSSDRGAHVFFYDVRTLVGESKQPKEAFTSQPLSRDAGSFITDLKWNPVMFNLVAVCLSDGSISVYEVTNHVRLYANLPATLGVTCVCWSPKGKQLAVGKQNGTVVQYVPTLEERKVIPCPSFYESDPVKVLDILWISTYVFAVVYAAADGSLETSPQLVMVLLPKKEDKRGERLLNFTETCYSSSSERQHHFFMNYIDDWEILLGASAASIEVSVIARPPDQSLWELWLLEDSSRAELPVTDNSEDTLPMGVVVSYTSQLNVFISEEKILPPSPVLLLLSTDGVLCPFHMVNETPGAKSVTVKPERVPMEGERPITAAGIGKPQPSPAFSVPATSLPIAAPSSSSPSLFGTSAGTPSFGKPAGAPVSSFSLETGGGAFEAATSKPEIVSSSTQAADSGVQPVAPSIRVNLKDKFGAVDSPQPKPSFGPSTTGFPSTPQAKTTAPSGPGSIVIPTPSQSMGTPSRPFSDVSQSSQIGPTPAGTQKAARVLPGAAKPTPPQAAVSGSFDKAADSKDPIHNGIKEEIAHFQKELDDLKMRTAKACFTVGTAEEMRQLRTDSDNHHEFLVEIQDTTKSLHGDIGCLKTTVLEGLANVENSKEQKERLSDPVYRRLLYKKPLDPRSEGQMQDIRRLHQYVKSEVQGVSDVLDLEWDRFVESKKKQKGYTVSDRETLFNTLANNREIINQQRQRLNQLMESLYRLRLYNCTSQWTSEESSNHSNDEVESLQDTLSKTTIDTTIKPTPKPTPKLSPVKQNQLRNFLTKRKMPPVRSLAPANLSRSSFLNPSYIEDLDDVSSSSSLSEAADSQRRFLEPQQEPVAQNRQETPPPDPSPVRPARHAPISRTVSVQPGFGTPAPQFGKVPPGSGPITSTPAVSVPTMRAIPPGADSTMLATKTVKHGAPTIPATQAAAAAAMRRQQITSLVTGAALTESTLQTVPKVVNVKELKGNGPGPNVMLVMAPTAPQTSVQANNQALSKVAAVQAKQVPLPGTLKAAPAPSSTPQPGPVMAPSKGTGPAAPPPSSMAAVAPGNKAFQFSSSSVFSSGPAPAATSAPSATFGSLVPGKDPHQPSGFMVAPGNKAVFAAGSETSAPFLSFMPPSSSSSADPGNAVKSPSAPSPTPVLQAKDTTQPANFMSGAGLKQQLVSPPDLSASILSVMPPSSAPADSSTSSKPAPAQVPSSVSAPSVLSPAGETLGSFSGLRVGQVEDASKAATLALQVKAQGGSSVVPSTKPGDSASTTTTGNASSMLFNAPGLVGMFNPGTTKPSFSFAAPASSAPPASTAPSALQASPAFGFLPAITSTQTPTAPIPVSSAAPSLFGADVRQSAAPEKSVPDSTAPSQLQALLAQPTEGSKEPAPSPAFVSAVSAPSAVASAAPTPAADTKTLTAPISTFPATINLGQNAAAPSTAAVLSPLAPPANTGLPSQTPGLVTTTTTGPPSTQISSGAGSTTTPGSAFVQPSAVSTATAATPVFGQAPAAPSGPLLFGQQSGGSSSTLGPSAPGSAFGSTGFGVTEGSSIFGQPTFSQTGSFWKAAPGSSNNFSFKPSSFGSQPIFGQTPTSTAVVSSSSGGLFGSSTNTSSASTFSFGQQAGSSSTSTAGGGLFGQGSTPGFGQSPSTFVQGTPAFGSASSSATTTTSSSVFGFGQPAGFPPSSSGSVFGQSQNPSSGVFGQQPSASSGGSLFGASSTASGGGGFFSGLGGKPSQEAANKNPFGSSGAAFSASGSNNSSSLFGNSGAKSFGFGGGNSTFGDQKASGTFSAGGSVASQGFGFTSPTKTGGFGAAPVFGSPPTFGGSPGFGGAPAFGTAQSFTSPLGSTSGKVFGEGTAAANTGGFGFGSGGGGGSSSGTTFGSLANQNTPSFGALSQQPTGFGGQNSGFGFGSGNSGAAPGTPGGFSFGSTNQQSSSAFGGGWRG